MDRSRSRDESRQMVLATLTEAAHPLSRTQLAYALDRQKTPHFIRLLDEMVEDGLLTREIRTLSNGVRGYYYRSDTKKPLRK
jgi:predicted transcriptional regulator